MRAHEIKINDARGTDKNIKLRYSQASIAHVNVVQILGQCHIFPRLVKL